MSQKLEFVEKAIAPGANVSLLCREYRISRQTGHKWIRRYREFGPAGLVEQSRRPQSSPDATGEEIVLRVLKLKERHPSWGPNKIALVLARDLGADAPSRSTVARVLAKLGKVKSRRRPARVWMSEGRPVVEVREPNDLWTIDFKGWWRARNGDRCEPLTVRDAFSRKVLAVALLASTRTAQVRRILEGVFRLNGLPLAMLSDNGSPFICTRARGGLTQLSVWLVSLGIRIVRSRPACPQDNGGHERMHRDLSELELTPASSRRTQQLECDGWTVDFNHVRPHEALGGKTPAEVYRSSPRRSLLARIPNYPPEWITRRVTRTGRVRINGDRVFLGSALAGQLVGLKQESGLIWRARFFDIDLGTVEIVPLTSAFASDSVIDTVSDIRARTGIRDTAVCSA